MWSGICDDGWDNTNAYVVCKQLNFATISNALLAIAVVTITCVAGSVAFTDSLFGNGNGPLVYSNVACSGSETSITQCSKTTYPDFTCSKNKAAGVKCADSKCIPWLLSQVMHNVI